MSKPTIYERRQQVAKEVAVAKVASVGGEHAYPFSYRGKQVFVEAKQQGGKIVTRTDPVANKGK